MPGKKPPEAWEVILEEIRSQNRATIEAVESKSSELKREIAGLREDTGGRLQTLESAVRQNSTDLQALQKNVRNLADKVEQNGVDIRRLDEKVDNLSGLEVRVSALEQQRG
jgi:archaellum component FlaC